MRLFFELLCAGGPGTAGGNRCVLLSIVLCCWNHHHWAGLCVDASKLIPFALYESVFPVEREATPKRQHVVLYFRCVLESKPPLFQFAPEEGEHSRCLRAAFGGALTS